MAHFTRTIIIYRASHSVFTSTSKTDEKPREIDAKLPLDFVPRFFALFQKYIFGLAPNPAGASTHPSYGLCYVFQSLVRSIPN